MENIDLIGVDELQELTDMVDVLMQLARFPLPPAAMQLVMEMTRQIVDLLDNGIGVAFSEERRVIHDLRREHIELLMHQFFQILEGTQMAPAG